MPIPYLSTFPKVCILKSIYITEAFFFFLTTVSTHNSLHHLIICSDPFADTSLIFWKNDLCIKLLFVHHATVLCIIPNMFVNWCMCSYQTVNMLGVMARVHSAPINMPPLHSVSHAGARVEWCVCSILCWSTWHMTFSDPGIISIIYI